MNLLLGFLPFAVFALSEHLTSTALALSLAAATAVVLVVHGAVSGKRLKWLDAGAAAVFAGLAIYTVACGAIWSVVGVRLAVDSGLLCIVLGSLVARHPFTLQYAMESTPPEVWIRPEFQSTNERLTGVWGGAFGTMVLADLAMVEGAPMIIGVVLTLAALGGAFVYTGRAAR